MIAALHEALHESEFGGKAAQLGHARRRGLPVPEGWALSTGFVERVVEGHPEAGGRLVEAFAALGRPVAVRSSAVGEDSASASFAGQHATVLNVRSGEDLLDAVRRVHASARTEAALAYRRRLGIAAAPRMGIVVQELVHASSSGVLFTRHPTTGADERVIEAVWGLGEAAVAGLVTPDLYRIARDGRVIERSPGDKDRAIVASDDGGTREVEVEPRRARAPCLDDAELAALGALAAACEEAFGGAQDLEWAFARGRLFLLQRRAITRA
jgi:pyruvate,water dikinase